jgi:vesicular inhibitory amino acid transporter
LALIDEYSHFLNRFAIWLLVLTPIAKYGLMLQPLNLSWELWFFNQEKVETWVKNHANWGKGLLTVLGRSTITGGLVYIALVCPGFDKVMVNNK